MDEAVKEGIELVEKMIIELAKKIKRD